MQALSSSASQVQATPQVANAPAAASLSQGSGTTVTVSWAPPATDSSHGAATGFNLRYSPSGLGTWTSVPGVSSPYTLSGLAASTAYDVQVQGMNAGGAGAWSPTSTLTTANAGPYPPGAPALAQGSGSNLTVVWTPPSVDGTHSTATSYNVRYSPSGAGAWTTESNVSSPLTLTGLAAGAAYDVQVQSANGAGASAWSASSTLTTVAAGLTIPNTVGAASLAQGTGSNLTVTWTASATDATHGAASSYNLRYSPAGASTWTTVSGVTSPYTLTGLTAAAAYNVQVQSANAAGSAAWSATSTLTTAAAAATGVTATSAPNAPAIASVAPPPTGTNSQLTVTWMAPATDSTHGAATGYNLRYSPSGANTWTTVTGVSSPYTLSGLTGATAIDVEVQGVNGASSAGAWSGIMTGTTWGATVVPGGWTAAAAQTHGANVAPNGGVQSVVVPAPTAVTGVNFVWASSASTIPTTGFIAAGADGQTNGWGQYMTAPATAGIYYLWTLVEGAGGATIGALVTSAITVS